MANNPFRSEFAHACELLTALKADPDHVKRLAISTERYAHPAVRLDFLSSNLVRCPTTGIELMVTVQAHCVMDIEMKIATEEYRRAVQLHANPWLRDPEELD